MSERTRRTAVRRFRPLMELLESIRLLSAFTFTVTSTADTGNDSTTANDGTLRGAIEAANNVGVGNSAIIDFSIAGAGVHTIAVFAGESLPSIVVPTALDGFSQGGGSYDGSPLIVIDGTNVPGANGITLDGNIDTNASNSTIDGLSIVNFHEADPSPESFVGAGIYLTVQAGSTLIAGNYLGILPDGTTAASNDYGIAVSSSSNTIGGLSAGGPNVISGNRTGGVMLFGQIDAGTMAFVPVLDTRIGGNFIGTDAAGDAAVPNGSAPTSIINDNPGPGYGIGVAGASDTTIGGTVAGAGNVISGNEGDGILITQYVSDLSDFDNNGGPVATSSNLVEANMIGTAQNGTSALGNNAGIFIANATLNTVGGTTAAAGNLISGNVVNEATGMGYGVVIVGGDNVNLSADTANVVEGNLIGTDVTGNASLGNAQDGVYVGDENQFHLNGFGDTAGATIGGSTAGAANIISANLGNGIDIAGGESPAADEVVQGNFIGVYANGTAIGNNLTGIYAINTAGLLIVGNTVEASGLFGIKADAVVSHSGIEIHSSTGTTIGGSAAGAGNIIGGNAADGVLLQGTPRVPSTGDLIEGNLIGVLADSTASGNGQDGILAQGTSGLAIFGNTAENNDAGIVVLNSIGTTIGGTALGAANVISDNLHPGLVLHQDQDLAVIGNTIESNGSSGITGGGFSGSSALFADNIIKSNAGAGIFIGGSSVTIEIQGNEIESNQNGGVVISAAGASIKSSSVAIKAISSSSSFAANIVGNTIKTNTGDGIFVTGGVVTLSIQGNDVAGNTANGINIEKESNATIGGSVAARPTSSPGIPVRGC